MYQYVQTAANRVIISNHVRHVNWLNIAIENVKLLIDLCIRKSAEDEPPSYTTKSFSNNLHRYMEIVQFVSFDCPHLKLGVDINHAVVQLFVVDVSMLLYMITKAIKLIIKSVPFAELHILNRMRRIKKEG